MEKLVLYGCGASFDASIGGYIHFDTEEEALQYRTTNGIEKEIEKITILDSFAGKSNVIKCECNGSVRYYRLADSGFCYYEKDKWQYTKAGGFGRAKPIYYACMKRGINILNDATHKLLVYKGVVYEWSVDSETYLSKKANDDGWDNDAYVLVVEYFPNLRNNDNVLGVTLDIYPDGGSYYCQHDVWNVAEVDMNGDLLPFKRSSIISAAIINKCYDVLYGREDCIHVEGEQTTLKPLDNPVVISNCTHKFDKRVLKPQDGQQ